MQKIRQRTKTLIALGDCAVTGNVPAMRNAIPVSQLLQSIYVEGQTERTSQGRAAAAAEAGAPGA